MKFDKPTADQVVAELSRAKTTLSNQRFLGLRITADQATVDALRQSTHPDADVVIGNIHISDLGHTLIMGCTGNAHHHILRKN